MKDNGTYLLYDFEDACFILFVMQIRLEPTGAGAIEENKPVYMYAHPHASVVKRPFANATMGWLLDVLTVNQTASFVQQDGLIWIPRIPRDLDGKNVTYRALQDNGNVNDINYTLNVMYGPSEPLTLAPRQTEYNLVSGDVMPDITCTAECKPSCSISWGKYSSGRTLSIGAVTTNDTGEYACIATRADSKTVEQTVNIHVVDEKAWLMHLSPKKTVYIVSAGDMFPDILCTADCNPPCDISWGIHSSNGQLQLGTVSKEMAGEYTCSATRNGSNRRVEKTVTIHVQDNTSFTTAIACLATGQALTTLGLGLCAFLFYRRNKQSLCQMCFNTIVRMFPNKNAGDDTKLHTAGNHGLEHYEDLDTKTRQTNKDYVTNVEGYASWCDFNKTIFVPEESTATFLANFTEEHYHIEFRKSDRTSQTIFFSLDMDFYQREGHISTDNFDWFDPSWKNRTDIISQLNAKGQIDIRIEISNISMKDNGTYYLYFGEVACFILFVMQIRLEPRETEAIEENMPVYVYAHPHASVITRPFANATMTWLVNGLSVNKTASFIQQDGLIWIPHITRGLDGSKVTYRAIHDNVNEVNYTLNVTYGPNQILSLEPERTQYYLVSGDIMPDIKCTADCKPPCSISWGKYDSGGTLRLGEVTSKDTGEYTCTATRTGVKTVERTISIHVADNTSFTIAIACLASVQALTTLGLGLCVLLSFRRNKQSPCQTCFSNSVRKSPNQKIEDCSNTQAADNHGLEHYEALDTNIIQKEKVYEVPTEVGLETYENIRLSSISTPEVQVAHS